MLDAIKHPRDTRPEWMKLLFGDLKKPDGHGNDVMDRSGVEARERRLAGRDWAAEVRLPEDPWAAWRRRVAAQRADPVAELAARPRQEWDAGQARLDVNQRLLQAQMDLAKRMQELNAGLQENNRLLGEANQQGAENPAMGEF